MEEFHPLFIDLAVILITAGITTVLFKWLKQPLVLGYIVAGFIIGPHFHWFPAVTDAANIKVWSDIGVVFLMFALGLEFSIKKLRKVGGTGAITAFTELFLMFLIGSSVGKIIGWGHMDCIFLGCMLSISSTTIIIKSFDDLKLKQQKFTSTVTGVLVVEDLVAVLLLVILSTISVSRHFDGIELGRSMVKLAFFLIVWFTFGIYLIPTLLKWMRKFMTEETLCIVSVGLCFGMVVFAQYAGFSSALGAFVMGAILSETIEASAIHKIITPIKNLFGAMFFVSVGSLVDPEVLVKYIGPVIIIALTVIIFKSLSATTGVLLSGKNLRTAIQSGFCFCQIGEFSFIIANLGLGFKVINPDLYPIIVSVSIITTFVTPYMIKAALPFYDKIYPMIPARFIRVMDRYANSAKSTGHEISVKRFVKKQLTSIIIYGVILTALSWISTYMIKPFTDENFPAPWGSLLGLGISLAAMAPFIWAMVVKNVNRARIKKLLAIYDHSQAIVIPILLLRYLVAIFFIGALVGRYINLAFGFLFVIGFFGVIVVLFSRKVVRFYNHIEQRFISNFNQRQLQNSFKIPESLEKNFAMDSVHLSAFSPLSGKTILESNIRNDYGINIVAIKRGDKVINLPQKETILMPLDTISIIGSEEQISKFKCDAEVEPELLIRENKDHEMNIYRLELREKCVLIGLDLVRSEFQKKYNAMIIAIEHNNEYILNPPARTTFQENDIVWFVSPDDIELSIFEMA